MEELSLAKKARSMFKKLEEIRKPYESDWEQIAQYIYYRREFFPLEDQQGKSIARDKYDGTASQAATNLVHGFQGYMVSQSIKWLDLDFEDQELEEYPEAMQWLEDLIHYLYEVFKKTNFYSATNENLMDAICFDSCLYCENDEEKGKIIYSERHPIEMYIAVNRYGIADTIFRKYKMSAREIVKQFPEGNISNKVKEDAEKSARMYNEHIIIHGVFPNEDKVVGSKRSKNKAFRSIYYEENAENEDLLLNDSGYDSNPYIKWWWDRNSTEWYSRTPSHNALPETLALNKVEKNVLAAVEKAVNPPIYAPGKNRGQIRTYPNAVNYYQNYEAERIEAIHQGIQLPITMEEREDIRNKIRRYFFNDFFLILSQLLQKQKTATEILEVQAEKAVVISPIIGRYETHFLDPTIERTYQIESEAGRIPEIPPVLEDYAGKRNEEGRSSRINIKYIGPLATLQERLYKTKGVVHTLSSITPMAELQTVNAPILDKFDFDAMAEEIARTQGMPAKAIRSDKDVEKLREARARAQQAMQQAEMMEKGADAVPKLGKKIEKGSMLDQIIGG